MSGTDVALATDGTSLTVTVDGVTTTQLLSGISSVQVTSSTLTIDAANGTIAAPIAFDGASLALVNSPTASDWTVNGDGTGNVAGGGVTSIAFTHVTHLSAGGSADTLHGPSADSAWTIDGANAGSVGGVTFTGFENLTGAPDNKDTFTLAPGGSVSGLVDGGDGGFDSLVVGGHRGSVVSNPSGPHSGTLVLDGARLTYAGLEPVTMSGATLVYNGADLGGSTEVGDKDLIQVSPGASGTIQIRDCLITGCSGLPDQAEIHTFTVSGTTSLTINGGLGGDTVEFTGDYLVPGSTLTVNAEHIKVDSGVTINVGTAVGNDINFNAVFKDNGLSLLGLTTTIPGLGDDALVDINNASLTGNKLNLTALSANLSTTVSGAPQDLSGGNLVVASVAGFDNSNGFFTVVGGTGTCAYTGRDIATNKLTGITGCTGTPADGAVVTSAVTENGSGKGVNHAAVELEYYANVNVYGNSTLTAVGDVTLASNVDVTSTANAVPVKGNWVSGTAYSKGDVVIDTTNNKRYAASKDLASGVSTTAPSGDSTNWSDASGAGSAVAASTFISHAISHLSDTSTITTSGGNVTISASLKSNITTLGNAIQSGSGAGIAVGVLVTDSEAYVDSTAATPVSAKGLTVSADTDNTAATTGTAAPGGADKGGNGTSANSPTQSAKQSSAAEGKADGKSTTADGNQDVSAALGVTVVIATTQAYISSIRPGGITIDATGGTQKIHAGAKNAASTTADGGNVKFSPDAPTATPLATGGTLADATYYYKIVAIYSTGDSLPSAEANAVVTGGGGSGSVSLSWTAVDNVTGYKIFRGDATGNETLLDTVGVVTTYNDDGSKTPDGSTKPSATDANSGIGVGVAVDVAVITTSAFARNANLEATTVTIESTAPSTSAFAANAISGAGGSSVGVAGSVAVNVTDSNTTTEIEGTDPVAVNGADLSLGATSNITNAALATAKQSTDGKASGVGISVAINVVNDTTTAGLPVNSVLNGAKNLTITADSTDAMTTTANGGASTGSGTVAFAAQAAISISNITTSATVASGPDLTLTGGLTAHATQTATVTTKASGDTKGGNAGIGLSLALVVANHAVDSQLERNLAAAGPVSFTADGSSITDTESTASSAGADEKQDDSAGGTDKSGKDVNGKADKSLSTASASDSSHKTSGEKTPGGEERRERRDHCHRRGGRRDRNRHGDLAQQDRRQHLARHDRRGEPRQHREHRLEGEDERERDQGEDREHRRSRLDQSDHRRQRSRRRHERPDRLAGPERDRRHAQHRRRPEAQFRHRGDFGRRWRQGRDRGRTGADDRRREDQRRDPLQLRSRPARDVPRDSAQRSRPDAVDHRHRGEHGQGEGDGQGFGNGRCGRRSRDQHRRRHDHYLDRQRCPVR